MSRVGRRRGLGRYRISGGEGPVRRVGRSRGDRRIKSAPRDPSREIYLLYRKRMRNAVNVEILDLVLKQANDHKAFLGETRCNKLEILADKQRRTFIAKEQTRLQKLKNAIPSVEKAELELEGGMDRALPTLKGRAKVVLKPRKKKSASPIEAPKEQAQDNST